MKTSGSGIPAANPAPILVEPLEGHGLWASTYDSSANPILALESRILEERFSHTLVQTFVDAGCGTGRWLDYFRQRASRVVGIDPCWEMLAQARRKIALQLIRADGLHLPIRDACADVVFCSFTAGYVEHLKPLVFELQRITRDDGTIVLSDLHPDARAAGWKRSFRHGDRIIEIRSHPHSAEDYFEVGRAAGLDLIERSDAAFGQPERALFARAGKEGQFEESCKIPAVLILEWKKNFGSTKR